MAEDDKTKPLSGKTEDQEFKPVPRNVWIPALAFTTACLILLFVAFFIGNLQEDQRKILNAIFSLLAGFATFFIGGTALIKLTGSLRGLKVAFTGTAGVAMFVFVLLHPIFTSASAYPPGESPSEKAQAAQKHARDEANMGWWHETGQVGGGKDYGAAMRWYLKAVEDGDATANWNIGRLYEFGFGVPKDLTKAKSWYQKAADKGVMEAQDSLANLGHNKEY